jgi:hypothetical protein
VADFGLVGVTEIEIEVEQIPVGTYDILVDGVTRGTLIMVQDGSKSEGFRHFEVIPDQPGELLLDFPVAGKPIVISQNGTTWFSGTIPSGS